MDSKSFLGYFGEWLCFELISKGFGVRCPLQVFLNSLQKADNEKHRPMRTDSFERSQLTSEMTMRCHSPCPGLRANAFVNY